VGGGPAGMEAGIVAARRGHDVYLIEEENKLGGQMLLAARPPGKSDIQKLTDYLTIRARKLGVKIELGKTVTPGVIDEMKPD
ncbi:MAG: FAD-dependent oxidoreductase, partial [Nitrososphaeria archaeon]|nr:FAD-dependent oxidoreductase [Nitrososphaeria archaeon]NIN52198.1 FAD-dependent oxidoreductase [Nitrososphaeria archaeon]NIQ32651.1 FAD-dependent oxidoreductase [Nitrososphaeria archaeon]